MTFHTINVNKDTIKKNTNLYFCSENDSDFTDDDGNYRCNEEIKAAARLGSACDRLACRLHGRGPLCAVHAARERPGKPRAVHAARLRCN